MTAVIFAYNFHSPLQRPGESAINILIDIPEGGESWEVYLELSPGPIV